MLNHLVATCAQLACFSVVWPVATISHYRAESSWKLKFKNALKITIHILIKISFYWPLTMSYSRRHIAPIAMPQPIAMHGHTLGAQQFASSNAFYDYYFSFAVAAARNIRMR